MSTTAKGELLHGILFDVQKALQIPFTEQVHNFAQGGEATPVGTVLANCEAIPLDANSTRVKVFDINAFVELTKDFCVELPEVVDFELPLTLTGVTISWNEGQGTGVSSHLAGSAAYTGFGSISSSPRASAQSSAAENPAVLPEFKETLARNVPAVGYSFYVGLRTSSDKLRARTARFCDVGQTVTVTLASPAVFTAAAHGFLNGDAVSLTTSGTLFTPFAEDVLLYIVNKTTNTFQLSATSGGSAINSSGTQSGAHKVHRCPLPWPKFKPQQHTVAAFGASATVHSEGEVSAAAGNPSFGNFFGQIEKGSGSGKDISLTTRVERWPAAIHGTITFSGNTTQTKTASATATATSATLAVSGGTTVASDSAGATVTLDAVGLVSPTGFAATSLAAIPVAGLYLKDIRQSSTDYGQPFVTAILVDFSYFA